MEMLLPFFLGASDRSSFFQGQERGVMLKFKYIKFCIFSLPPCFNRILIFIEFSCLIKMKKKLKYKVYLLLNMFNFQPGDSQLEASRILFSFANDLVFKKVICSIHIDLVSSLW